MYEKEIDEPGKKLKLWVRRKKAGLKLICSGCGQHVPAGRRLSHLAASILERKSKWLGDTRSLEFGDIL